MSQVLENEFHYIDPPPESHLKWVTCKVCGTKAPHVHIPEIPDRGVPTRGEALNTDSMYESPDESILILGRWGSIKTTFLMFMTMFLFSNAYHHRDWICPSQYGKGYLPIVRSVESSKESLIYCDVAPVRFFLPKDCRIEYDHPNLHQFEHDLDDYMGVVKNLRRDMINIIGIDHFLEGDAQYEWWWNFFSAVLEYKTELPGRAREPWMFVCDEMKYLMPNIGQQDTKGHLMYGNRLRRKFDAFRKSKIKFLVTTHYMTDLRSAFRNNFSYWVFKQMRSAGVPDEIKKNADLIQSLQKGELFITGSSGRYKNKPSNSIIWTYPVAAKIIRAEYLKEATTKDEAKWAWRARRYEYLLQKLGLSIRQLSLLGGWGGAPSGIQDFRSRYPLEKCPFNDNFEEILSQFDIPKIGLKRRKVKQTAAKTEKETSDGSEESKSETDEGEGIDQQLALMEEKEAEAEEEVDGMWGEKPTEQ